MNDKLERAIRAVQNMSDQPMDKLKQQITAHLTMISGSTIAFFGTMNAAQNEMTIIGFSAGAMVNCRMIDKPVVYRVEDVGLWGDPIRERKAVIVNDYENLNKPTKKGHPEGHLKVKRFLGVPVREGGKYVLLVGVGNKPDEYTQEDAQNIETFMAEVWKVINTKV